MTKNKKNILGGLWAAAFGSTTKTVVVGQAAPGASTLWVGVGFALVGERGSGRRRMNINPQQKAKGFIAQDVGLFASSEQEAAEIAKVNDLSRAARLDGQTTKPMSIARVLAGSAQDPELVAECNRLLGLGITSLDVNVRVKFDRKRTLGFQKVELIFRETNSDSSAHRTAWYGVKGNYVPRRHHSRRRGENTLGLYWELEVSEVIAATAFIHEKTRYADPYGDEPIVVLGGGKPAPAVRAMLDAGSAEGDIDRSANVRFAELAE